MSCYGPVAQPGLRHRAAPNRLDSVQASGQWKKAGEPGFKSPRARQRPLGKVSCGFSAVGTGPLGSPLQWISMPRSAIRACPEFPLLSCLRLF